MSEESDTPEVDSVKRELCLRSKADSDLPMNWNWIVPAEFATRLERERDEALDRLDNSSGVHSCSNHCQRPLCSLRRELRTQSARNDRLEEVNKQLHYDLVRAQNASHEWEAAHNSAARELNSMQEYCDASALLINELRARVAELEDAIRVYLSAGCKEARRGALVKAKAVLNRKK